MKFIRKEYFIILILILAAILLFTNISNDYLWEDEAETAVIARNILKYIWPSAHDGQNLVTQEWGHDSNDKNIWIHQTWLPHYVVAFSFLLCGVSTWSARLPFALIALIAIGSLYFLIGKVTKDRMIARVAVFLLLFSVTFLLHMRQCRYYALIILFTILWVFLYWRWLRGDKLSWTGLALVGAALFHAQYITALASWASTALSGQISLKNGPRTKQEHFKLWGGMLFLCLPWAIYARLWEKTSEVGTDLIARFINWLINIVFYLFSINHFIFPIILLGVIVVWSLKDKLTSFEKYYFLSGIIYFLIMCLNPLYPDIRYLIVLLPWAAYFLAKIFSVIYIKNKIWASIFLLSVLLTNLWSLPFWYTAKNILPKSLTAHYKGLRLDLLNYFYELTHKNIGPGKAAITYLKAAKSPGDTIFVSYGAEPIIFYTDLKILRKLPFCQGKPDWIILKGNTWYKWAKWVLLEDGLTGSSDENKYIWNYKKEQNVPKIWQNRRAYITNYIHNNEYEKIVMSAPNLIWENRPNLLLHQFGSEASTTNKLVIYRKI